MSTRRAIHAGEATRDDSHAADRHQPRHRDLGLDVVQRVDQAGFPIRKADALQPVKEGGDLFGASHVDVLVRHIGAALVDNQDLGHHAGTGPLEGHGRQLHLGAQVEDA
ncbi:MAG: hypothetical protein ACO38W_13360, partial [Phycisphaerales bacterium]